MSDDVCIMGFLDTVYECPVPEPIEEVEEGIEIDLDADLEPEYKPRDYSEKLFEDIICSIFDREQRIYERQKPCANGIIDIITWYQCPDIIEVKRSGSPHNLIKAIVQLKFYSACYRRASMFIAVPGGIAKEHLHILKEFGVYELRVIKDENGVWRFD